MAIQAHLVELERKHKILEHEFRVGKKWPNLRKALGPWDEEFRSLKVSSQLLVSFIHDLRNRCAHIRIGNSGDLGLTGLSTEDTEAVDKVMSFGKPVELAPQSAHIRRLQHQLVEEHGLGSESRGEVPWRRVIVLPTRG